MRSFAIEDPGSPDPPLYATLVDVDLEIEHVRRLRNIEQLRLLLFAEILLVMGMKSGICGDIL